MRLFFLFFGFRAGFYYEVVEQGHFVPGNERFEAVPYKGKSLWGTIMECTDETACVYARRVDTDFNKAVSKTSTQKYKARL
jgi:hypothetical protein